MLRLTKMADYSVVILSMMSEMPESIFSASAIAEKTTLGEPTVSKLLKIFAKAKFVSSIRGAKGGYKTAKDLANISILEVIEAVEGKVSITDCSCGKIELCPISKNCKLKGSWCGINKAITEVLDSYSIEDILNRTEATKKVTVKVMPL